jgi:hypothetical protein
VENAKVPPSVDELRTLAIDLIRAQDWPELLALEAALRADSEYWIQFWGAACAIAAWHQRRPDARDMLQECISGGFHQVDDFGSSFDSSFGTEPDWPDLLARIRANLPPPPVELISWPCAKPAYPLRLFRLEPDGEARLAARLPAAGQGAWATAQRLLHWVTSRWRHIGTNHYDSGDANTILDRVERGERFACKEYTIVLTQALNAMQIPARGVGLYRAGYHAGMGGGHAVSEAWMDDLGRWVLLDGQNGATWRDSGGMPLGVLELQQRFLAGHQPEFSGTGHNFDAGDAGQWFSYFHAAGVTGVTWSDRPFAPLLEGSTVISCDRLADGSEDVAPDLAAISTGITDDHGPALAFRASHPYPAGFAVTGPDGERRELELDQGLPLYGPAGDHHLSVAVRTRYADLRPHAVHYVVR